MNAVIYARYSSDKQSEQSIEGQLRVCENYASNQGFCVVERYIDRAMTGKNDDRPAFQKMIADSEKKLFDFVLVYKLDRFSRSRYDSAINKRILQKRGVKVLSATEGISDTPEGIILESMLEGYAEYYSAELAQKIRRGQLESVLKGRALGSKIPLGYKIVEHRFIIDEEKAALVRRCFELYANGETIKTISKVAWNVPFETIRHLLGNRKYIGVFTYGGKEYMNVVPQIVQIDLFNQVQEKLSQNKKSPARGKAIVPYELSGKLFCGYCQRMMVGDSGYGKMRQLYHYYRCPNKRLGTCQKETVLKDWLENIVVDKTAKHILDDKILKPIIDNLVVILNSEKIDETIVKGHERDLSRIKKQLDNMLTAIKNGLYNETMNLEMERLENEKALIEHRIESEKAKKGIPIDRDMIMFWFDQFKKKSADNKQKSLIIDAFVNKVVLFDDRMIIVYNHMGKNEENISISELCSDNPLLVVLKAQNPNPIILKGHLLLIVPLCSQDTRR